MTKTLLATMTALTLTAGAALAQTMTTTTSTESTAPVVVPVPMPVAPPVSQSTTERTVDANGVVTDHSRTITSGSTMSPYGDITTTRRTTETTTTR